MERMQSMFQNPFGSKAGQLIERGTVATLEQEDWAINMEIVDVIGSYEDGPKDAVRAFRKRLSSNKSTKQLELTLSVLETCVKNCGLKFHILIMSRDFCNDVLAKMLNPKMNIPIVIQQRVLSLIQQWAETFKEIHALIGVVQVYNELLEQGHEFPKPDNRANVPILTPKRTHESPPPAQIQPRLPAMVQPIPQQRVPANRPPPQPTTGPINPSPEQSAKLHSDLTIVLGNVNVLSEMLTDLVPGQTDPSDLELLQELHRTCKAMQQRIVELVERIANEEITVELLRVNDDLNNVFLRYERFERYRESAKTTSPPTNFQPPPQPYHQPPQPYHQPHNEPPPSYSTTEPAVVDNLIDLNPAATAQLPEPVKPVEPQPLSDDFANLNLDQMLSTPNQPASFPSLSDDLAQFDSLNPQPMMSPEEEKELSQTEHEIEQWLNPQATTPQSNHYTQPEPANTFETTDDFNAFLSERAKAGETQPDVSTTQTSNGSDSRQRNIQQDSQPMFGL